MAGTYGSPLASIPSLRIPRTGSAGGFGARRSPTHVHQGVDLVYPVGTPWTAIADGIVEYASNGPARGFGGYGKIAVLRFTALDGQPLWVLYAHGREVFVSPGQHVARGETLGEIGRSRYLGGDPSDDGRMGAHLHLELATRAYPMGPEAPYRIDPYRWFQQMRVVVPGEAKAFLPMLEDQPAVMPWIYAMAGLLFGAVATVALSERN